MVRQSIQPALRRFYSCQAIIAADAMDKRNGSTQVVPFSTHLDELDVRVLDPAYAELLEPRFVNVTLEQGDVPAPQKGRSETHEHRSAFCPLAI